MSHTATQSPQEATSKVLMGAGLVWMAVIIYAASNSIVSLLADIGRFWDRYSKETLE